MFGILNLRTAGGISSKAIGKVENRYKYNGIELDTSLGIDEYEATLRDLDPQTGRWWQIDPETENQEMWSAYTSNNDNPIFYKDPRGNEGEECCGGIVQLGEDVVKIYRAVRSGENIIDAAKGSGITVSGVINGIGKLIEFDQGGVIKVPVKKEQIDPKPIIIILPPDTKVPTQVHAKGHKGRKDLVGEAKAAQEKEAAAAARAVKREAATRRGNTRTGNSNEGTQGSHNSGGNNRQKHTKGNARRAADQKVKGPDNTY